MGRPAARITDMHVCPMVTPGTPPIPHVGGPIIGPGCPTVLIGNIPAAVMGDMCTCVGPPDTIVLGSTGVMIGGKPAVRIGDQCAHGGAITVGCPTVLIGEVNGSGGDANAGGLAAMLIEALLNVMKSASKDLANKIAQVITLKKSAESGAAFSEKCERHDLTEREHLGVHEISEAEKAEAAAPLGCKITGIKRIIPLQPVFLKYGDTDLPTGLGLWESWLADCQKIWGKLGVSLEAVEPVTIKAGKVKWYGGSPYEIAVVRSLYSDPEYVEVFFVENDMTSMGGAQNLGNGTMNSKIVISTNASSGHLAHELGHVLGIDHPTGSEDHIMVPTGSVKGKHNTRNPIINYYRMTFPAKALEKVCLFPDP